jgi:hypothetical protein
MDELVQTLPADQALDLSLVVDATGDASHSALRTAATDPRLTLVAVEAALARLGADAATIGGNLRRLPGVTGFLETPRTHVDEALDLVAEGGWQAAKYRTGGTTAEAFPTERELAEFLVACGRRDLPFKLTAGLHHIVRNTDPATGFEQHGVLNVLLATLKAGAGADADVVAETLADRDSGHLVAAAAELSDPDVKRVRSLFRSFGCCGVTDPIGELATAGLIQPPV